MDIEAMMKEMDTDKSGGVSKEEAYNAITSYAEENGIELPEGWEEEGEKLFEHLDKTEMEKSPTRKSRPPNHKLKLKSSNMLTKMAMVNGASKRSLKPSKHWLMSSMLSS